ncbi:MULTISPECIES: twin-arginine translocase subunit TatC [unclassified Microbulbifer]|uniref:Sec-independent protein translocase protein TatC n=1 Tax=Microbulbifer spongiae TaxID=2944933 RepID=A0ABY9EAW9_9GAMM|nr:MULTISPECIES: twin-arginine translocase subunit TatC [unclassified Microbulbifer]MDP5210109.1 twin-arginine translocase subunit TatC [Microbulbifer sp. 2205BS26-8]WKD49615.1 twin-arginine translocase subunit TatC [Microbulbifer sp. MI-G]
MSDQPPDSHQPFIDHLIELRDRLLRILLVVVILFAGMVPFAAEIYDYIANPLQGRLLGDAGMIATEVTSTFLTPFKTTFILAFFIAIPFVLYQAWAFIAPGLYKNEKRIAIPILMTSVVLFYAGIAFAYFVVFPILFDFFVGAAPADIKVMPDMRSYLDLVLKLFFAFGFAFEIPIATVLLIWSGAVDAKVLAQKRPYVIVGCFLIGMLLTPPDVISQSLLALPMWLLFEVGILFGRWVKSSPGKTPAEGG